MYLNKKGFTLIELIIVIVIIGILASIAVPMMAGVKAKAICAEAVTGMSTLRQVIRQYYVEYGGFPADWGWGDGVAWPDVEPYFEKIGFKVDCLNGTYFDKWCYVIYAVTPGKNNIVCCYPRGSKLWYGPAVAPGYLDAYNIVDDDNDSACLVMWVASGRIKQYYISRSGYPPYE